MKTRIYAVTVALCMAACATNKSTTSTAGNGETETATTRTETTEAETSTQQAPEDDPNVQTIIEIFDVLTEERRHPAEFYADGVRVQLMHSVLMPEPVPVAEFDEATLAMSSDMQIRPLRIFVADDGVYMAQVYLVGTYDGKVDGSEPTNEKMGLRVFAVFTFDDDGKVTDVRIRRNEMRFLVQIGRMKSPMGTMPQLPPMPEMETVVVRLDDTPNEELVAVHKELETRSQKRPFPRESVGELFADEAEFGMPVRAEFTKETYLDNGEAFTAALSAGSVEYDQFWTAGDVLLVSGTNRAKHVGKLGPFEATNEEAVNPYFNVWTIEDGKIVAGAAYGNPLYTMKSLGLFPPPKPPAKASK